MKDEPKPVSSRACDRICENLKNTDFQAFKALYRHLQTFEKRNNLQETHRKLQEVFGKYPHILKELNEFMYKQFHLKPDASKSDKLQDFLRYLKSNSEADFKNVRNLLMELQKEEIQEGNDNTLDQKIIKSLFQMFKSNAQITKILKDLLEDPDIKSFPKVEKENTLRRPDPKPADQPDDLQKTNKEKLRKQKEIRIEIVDRNMPMRKRDANINMANIIEVVTEQSYLFQGILKLKYSEQIFKLLHLYELCIITRAELIAQLSQEMFSAPEELDMLKDAVESREISRLKSAVNVFKPLNEMDFSRSERAGPSYVEMPFSYINKQYISRPEEYKNILNGKWILVPMGSNFSIKQKNPHEINLIKSEDEKYQFDLYMSRLRKTEKILNKIINDIPDDKTLQSLLSAIVGMGIIENIYKNCQREQKEELEVNFKSNHIDTCKVVRQRVLEQIKELKNIKEVHGLRAWHEAAEKNFYKSLDRRSFYFKQNQKQYNKPTYFQNQLDSRLQQLNNLSEQPPIFKQKTQFFCILNTFQNLSKYERCSSHRVEVGQIVQYDVQKHPFKNSLPIVTMTFRQDYICEMVNSLIMFYVQQVINSENEKNKIKLFLNNLSAHILGWRYKTYSLSDAYSEEEFYKSLTKGNSNDQVLKFLVEVADDSQNDVVDRNKQIQTNNKSIRVQQDCTSQFNFLPHKRQNDIVFFGSVNFYATIRLLFILYERILKSYEIIRANTQDQNQVKVAICKFKILFMLCIKTKESPKFEDNLNSIFGKVGYLFSTTHKLVQTTVKSIQTCASDTFTTKLLEEYINYKRQLQNEDFYLQLVNKLSFSSNNNNKIIRFCITANSRLVFVNLFNSYYKGVQLKQLKQQKEKNCERGLLQGIKEQRELYIVKPVLSDFQTVKNGKKLIQKKNSDKKIYNEMEYHCLPSTKKLISRLGRQDQVVFRKKGTVNKQVKKQLKRKLKIEQWMNRHVFES